MIDYTTEMDKESLKKDTDLFDDYSLEPSLVEGNSDEEGDSDDDDDDDDNDDDDTRQAEDEAVPVQSSLPLLKLGYVKMFGSKILTQSKCKY